MAFILWLSYGYLWISYGRVLCLSRIWALSSGCEGTRRLCARVCKKSERHVNVAHFTNVAY